MDILSKLNDSDALKERFESNLPLSSSLKHTFRKYFLVVAKVSLVFY